MRSSTPGLPLGALLCAAALGACATPARPPAGASFELEAFRWRAEATPQSKVVATNRWGDLRVRTAARGGLVVSAMIQKIGTTRDELEIRFEESADAVAVRVVPLVARPRGRVDLTLLVPPGKRVEGTTRDGIVEIKYSGEARARSRGGAITIDSVSRATAHSRSGSITARLGGGPWRQPLSFASRSGDVSVSLPDDARVLLRAEAAGALAVGFAAEPTGRRGARRSIVAALGGGGSLLRVESVAGDVRVIPYSAPTRVAAAD